MNATMLIRELCDDYSSIFGEGDERVDVTEYEYEDGGEEMTLEDWLKANGGN